MLLLASASPARRRLLEQAAIPHRVQVSGVDEEAISHPAVQDRDVTSPLTAAGWTPVATRGRHRPIQHPHRPGRVPVAGKQRDDLATGTLKSIAKQYGVALP